MAHKTVKTKWGFRDLEGLWHAVHLYYHSPVPLSTIQLDVILDSSQTEFLNGQKGKGKKSVGNKIESRLTAEEIASSNGSRGMSFPSVGRLLSSFPHTSR